MELPRRPLGKTGVDITILDQGTGKGPDVDRLLDWSGADLEAAPAACPNRLDFARLLPRVESHLARSRRGRTPDRPSRWEMR